MNEESIMALTKADVEVLELDEPTTGDPQADLLFEQANSRLHLAMQSAGEMLYFVRDCGRALLAAKERCPHGKWTDWVDQHFHASLRQAQKYMRIAWHWEQIAAMSGLDQPSFNPKANSDSFLSIEGALSLLSEPEQAPELPPAPIVDVIDGEIVSEEPTPDPSQEGKRLDNPNASNEHYTPDDVLTAVYECLGTVDLDPCSDGSWPPNVNAAHHYTAEHDGLAQEWMGKVFMNCPYNPSGTIAKWVSKLLEEVKAGRVTEAIVLIPAYTDTASFTLLREYPVCLVRGRLTFKGNDEPARFPSAIFYLGHNVSAFGAAFHELGDFWLCSDLED